MPNMTRADFILIVSTIQLALWAALPGCGQSDAGTDGDTTGTAPDTDDDSEASYARIHVNGVLIGVYVNVEQVDKSFLTRKVGDNDGWLWKFSGSDGDGLKTNEGTADPYAGYYCFLERNGCAPPSDAVLATELPHKLDIPQLLTVGAVNALMANTDSPLLKFNNYIYYDWPGPRLYFPWDLDTVMNSGYDVLTGSVPGGTTVFTDVLFTHWKPDYIAIMQSLLETRLPMTVISAEIDRAVSVAANALDEDAHIEGTAGEAAATLHSWWGNRHAKVGAQIAP
jgi:hypothetical protein